MFKFLKEKLKKATSIFTKKVEEEKEPEIEKEEVEKKIEEEVKEKRRPEKELKRERKTKEIEIEKSREEKKTVIKKLKEKITKTIISEKRFEELFWSLEVALMENNVAIEVIEKIKEDLKKSLVEKPIDRRDISGTIRNSLKESIEELFSTEQFDFIAKVKEKKPCVMVFVGINGSGKTTTIAKVAQLLKKNHLRCVIAASDTFRAASIEQLQKHSENLGVKLIKHDYKADPAAVAFDAIKHAKAHNLDCVLVDTAGRMHSNVNLIDEMKKIVRVSNPDLKIFVGEAITGNDCVEQAKKFNEAVGIDGIILSKADVDEKGGAAISVGFVTKKPILYLGVGQRYDDLVPFDQDKIIEALGLN